MLYDVGLGGSSDDDQYQAALHRIADAIGYSVGDLLNSEMMDGELAQTAELMRLWQKVGPDTRQAVIAHLKIATRKLG